MDFINQRLKLLSYVLLEYDLLPRANGISHEHRRQPRAKLSVKREIEIIICGVLAGILAHIIYLLFIVMLPASSSGAAILGERFNDLW
jgi:hypothetical protein